MNINEIRFKAVEADRADCKGCMFHGEKSRTCHIAGAIAKEDGMPDCDDRSPSGKTYIYVLDESDPRQIPLIDQRGEVVG